MRYVALAVDFDGTLAHGGRVADETVERLEALRKSGRRALLVTGRELDDLSRTFPRLELFDRVVAENGALLYDPATRRETLLAEPPPGHFVDLLRSHHVEPLSTGRCIVATNEPHQQAVLDAIRELGLELQVIFNKGSVMVLPSGCNKASGLLAALTELQLSVHNVVGAGDAENDHAFLSICECAVAVANALPALKERADFVTTGPHGQGIAELIDAILENDLQDVSHRLARHDILIGKGEDGSEVRIPAYGSNVLVAGGSGAGKSTIVTAALERFNNAGYQFCIIDPEGDYNELPFGLTVGTSKQAPDLDAVIQILEQPGEHAIVSLLAIRVDDRPDFFARVLSRLADLRARTGRPQWIVIDEAHHLVPEQRQIPMPLSSASTGIMMVTLDPKLLAPDGLRMIDVVLAVGDKGDGVLRAFATVVDTRLPAEIPDARQGTSFFWTRGAASVRRFTTIPSEAEHNRHRRKYAEGELGPDVSFYFRGPAGKLALKAHNLKMFLHLAEGVDDETWLHHLQRGDYSTWFREAIKDPDLARSAEQIERTQDPSAEASRSAVSEAIKDRYAV